MATGLGNGKPDKALKEKQNKLTLMGKVLMRDKHDKHSKRDRVSKATSDYHLETMKTTEEDPDIPDNLDRDAKTGFKGSTESLGKSRIRSSFMDKVRFRDKAEKRKRKERDSLATSQELETEDTVAKDNFKGSTESLGKSKGLSSFMDKVRFRDKSDKQSRKNRDSLATSQELDTEVPVAKEDFGGSNESLGKRQSSFLDMVRFRDKSDKHNRKERDSKSYSNDLETVTEVVTKETQDPSDEPFSRQQQHRSSFIDKVLMRDRQDKVSKKDRESKVTSADLDVVATTTKYEGEECDVVATLQSEVPDEERPTVTDKMRLRHEKVARKEREARGRDPVFKSTSMGDLSTVDGTVQLRHPLHDRSSPRKEKNRLSSASVLK